MPYEVIMDADGCDGHAVVKVGSKIPIDGGCHSTHDEALDQMAALYVSELDEMRIADSNQVLIVDIDDTLLQNGVQPIQKVIDYVNNDHAEYLVVIVTGRFESDREATVAALSNAGVQYDRLVMNQDKTVDASEYKKDVAEALIADGKTIDKAIDNDSAAREAYSQLGIEVIDPSKLDMKDENNYRHEDMVSAIDEAINLLMAAKMAYESDEKDEPMDRNKMQDDEEYRAVNLVAPAFMRASAKRGLVLHGEGESGDGLVPATVADARRMSNGEALSENKWRKISPWIARHIDDLDAVQGNEITAGLVAMLLWGGGSSKASARRAQAYAERIVSQLENETRAPAPKKDQIKGSDENPEGSAQGKTGGIVLNEATTTALQNKAKEHNDKMKERNRPDWTRTTLGALKAVYRRGAGAFSGSHRPGIGRAQWAMARVNAFLFLCRTGKASNPNYVTDNDLLNPSHPKHSSSGKDK